MLRSRPDLLKKLQSNARSEPWVIAWARGFADHTVTSEDIVGIYTSQARSICLAPLHSSIIDQWPIVDVLLAIHHVFSSSDKEAMVGATQ